MQDTQLAPPPAAVDTPPPVDTPPAPVLDNPSDQLSTPPPEQVPPQQVAPPPPPPPAPVPYDVEMRAREMGWRPKDQWSGHPDAWKPADEFVRRGEEVLPIVRARATRAEARVAQLEGDIAGMAQTFDQRLQRLDRLSQVALRRQAEQITNYYEGLKRQAVDAGDTAQYDRITQAQHQAMGEFQQQASEAYNLPEPTPQQQQQRQQQPVDPEIARTVQDWTGRQDWWGRDQELTQAAVEYHGFLRKMNPHQPVSENLADTQRWLRDKFPHKFPGQRTQPPPQQQQYQQPPQQQPQYQQQPPGHAPAVEGGGRQAGGGARPKGWNELPAEAKAAGEKYIGQGLFGADPAKARQEYAAEYWAQPD